MLDPNELFPEVPNLYEFLSVHADMVYDQERVSRYQDAVGALLQPGDTVVDIGTGTGLLAFLCLQLGARHVYAIDRSRAIKWAKLLAKHHRLANKITFYSADSRDVELPEKVNIVISEMIGHVAFEEGMAESLFDARARFLSQGGTIIPQVVSLMVGPVCENEVYDACVNCWQDVHGFSYSLLRQDALGTCYVTEISNDKLMALPKKMFTLDLANGQPLSKLSKSAKFTIYRSGDVNGIAMWFDAKLAPDVYLSSSPWSRTHWKQCFAAIGHPIHVQKGGKLEVQINMRMRKQRHDTFDFSFKMNRI